LAREQRRRFEQDSFLSRDAHALSEDGIEPANRVTDRDQAARKVPKFFKMPLCAGGKDETSDLPNLLCTANCIVDGWCSQFLGRASELCGLRWDQIDLNTGRLHVRRAKGGIDNVHPLGGKEIRALRQLRRENTESRYVFVTERGGPATTAGFLKMISRTGEAAKLPFPIHPHMLRHSTGYKLANDGHDTRALRHYMGHKNIMHTVRYTEMAPDRFKDFWRD
jgi:type 1 fimbriae regulatory protein FimE